MNHNYRLRECHQGNGKTSEFAVIQRERVLALEGLSYQHSFGRVLRKHGKKRCLGYNAKRLRKHAAIASFSLLLLQLHIQTDESVHLLLQLLLRQFVVLHITTSPQTHNRAIRVLPQLCLQRFRAILVLGSLEKQLDGARLEEIADTDGTRLVQKRHCALRRPATGTHRVAQLHALHARKKRDLVKDHSVTLRKLPCLLLLNLACCKHGNGDLALVVHVLFHPDKEEDDVRIVDRVSLHLRPHIHREIIARLGFSRMRADTASFIA